MHFHEAYDPFRALKSAFGLVRKAPAALLIGGLLLWICEDVHLLGNFGGEQKVDLSNVDPADSERVREVAGQLGEMLAVGVASALGVFLCGLAIAGFLFGSLVRVGMARSVERALSEGADEIEDLFQSRGRWGSMVLTRLLQGLVEFAAALPGLAIIALAVIATLAATDDGAVAAGVGVVAALLYVPVLVYVWLGVMLAPYAAAVEGMGPTEALSRSWALVRGHRWTLLLYWLVMALVQVLLLCACCCMLLFLPKTWAETAGFESYLRLVRSGDPSSWNDKPSPPASELA